MRLNFSKVVLSLPLTVKQSGFLIASTVEVKKYVFPTNKTFLKCLTDETDEFVLLGLAKENSIKGKKYKSLNRNSLLILVSLFQ